jgi:hypothetical protein
VPGRTAAGACHDGPVAEEHRYRISRAVHERWLTRLNRRTALVPSSALRCPPLLALSGKDGGDEFGVGMAAPLKVADNGINVKGHAAVGDG